MLYTYNVIYPKGTIFNRIRPFKEQKEMLEQMNFVQDAWNCPANLVTTYGRLHRPNESLLYVSPNAITAIEETKIKYNQPFALIQYEATEDIKANCMGIFNVQEQQHELSSNQLVKLRIINDFIKDEFTRDVGKGTEYLYRTSEFIAKHFFDLPPRVVQDAWCYPSIANKPSVNLCFRPEIAKEILQLKGIQLGLDYEVSDSSLKLSIIGIMTEGYDGDLLSHKIGSEKQKEVFPHIQ